MVFPKGPEIYQVKKITTFGSSIHNGVSGTPSNQAMEAPSSGSGTPSNQAMKAPSIHPKIAPNICVRDPYLTYIHNYPNYLCTRKLSGPLRSTRASIGPPSSMLLCNQEGPAPPPWQAPNHLLPNLSHSFIHSLYAGIVCVYRYVLPVHMFS